MIEFESSLVAGSKVTVLLVRLDFGFPEDLPCVFLVFLGIELLWSEVEWLDPELCDGVDFLGEGKEKMGDGFVAGIEASVEIECLSLINSSLGRASDDLCLALEL